jgi:hypothetical protein
MYTTINNIYVTSIGIHTIPDNVSISRVVSPYLECTMCCSTNVLQHIIVKLVTVTPWARCAGAKQGVAKHFRGQVNDCIKLYNPQLVPLASSSDP